MKLPKLSFPLAGSCAASAQKCGGAAPVACSASDSLVGAGGPSNGDVAFTARRRGVAATAAFTLVEIALAVAIIGFALVAIIGVLPAGLNVQRENREETIVVHDANFLLDAIRNGVRGLDDLTNYVDSITNYSTGYEIVGGATNVLIPTTVFGYTYRAAAVDNADRPQNVITNGERIIGLLSTPKYTYRHPDGSFRTYLAQPIPDQFISNYVIAYVRALSGSAADKAPQANPTVRDLAFRYRLITELNAFSNWNTNWFDTNGFSAPEVAARVQSWHLAQTEQANLREIRLLFRWPIDSRGNAGNGRQVFRALVGGELVSTNHRGLPIWLMQSGTYQAVQ
jgi:type II secretory pathway pseudopilin PulG